MVSMYNIYIYTYCIRCVFGCMYVSTILKRCRGAACWAYTAARNRWWPVWFDWPLDGKPSTKNSPPIPVLVAHEDHISRPVPRLHDLQALKPWAVLQKFPQIPHPISQLMGWREPWKLQDPPMELVACFDVQHLWCRRSASRQWCRSTNSWTSVGKTWENTKISWSLIMFQYFSTQNCDKLGTPSPIFGQWPSSWWWWYELMAASQVCRPWRARRLRRVGMAHLSRLQPAWQQKVQPYWQGDWLQLHGLPSASTGHIRTSRRHFYSCPHWCCVGDICAASHRSWHHCQRPGVGVDGNGVELKPPLASEFHPVPEPRSESHFLLHQWKQNQLASQDSAPHRGHHQARLPNNDLPTAVWAAPNAAKRARRGQSLHPNRQSAPEILGVELPYLGHHKVPKGCKSPTDLCFQGACAVLRTELAMCPMGHLR